MRASLDDLDGTVDLLIFEKVIIAREHVLQDDQIVLIRGTVDLLHLEGSVEKLDRDMDRGWQMSRQFVARPDRLQRCQIVADRLLTSLTQGNQATGMLMAAYIALRMPGSIGVAIDAEGEMQNTEVLYA